MSLEPIRCDNCKELLFPNGEIKKTSCYEDCVRRCDNCCIGYSNAVNNPTLIYREYFNNVPELVRTNLEYTLDNSLNIRNRVNKKKKFAFSTSEDALTWTFFSYFVINKRQKDLLSLLNIESNELECEVYLWGVNISIPSIDDDIVYDLINASRVFGEAELSRTEPDVIIKLGATLIFIEVKYKSPNDITDDTLKFRRYLIPGVDNSLLFESGHYELYRNWAFASFISNGENFKLINLGPQRLFFDNQAHLLQLFEDSLSYENGEFVKLSWEEIIEKMEEGNYDTWFMYYLYSKI